MLVTDAKIRGELQIAQGAPLEGGCRAFSFKKEKIFFWTIFSHLSLGLVSLNC